MDTQQSRLPIYRIKAKEIRARNIGIQQAMGQQLAQAMPQGIGCLGDDIIVGSIAKGGEIFWDRGSGSRSMSHNVKI